MTQSETSIANRRRMELYAAFDGLSAQVGRALSDARAVAMRANEIVDAGPPPAIGQAAVDLGCEAEALINDTRGLWDELLGLSKEAALGGWETP
jgi:hypothetical protein